MINLIFFYILRLYGVFRQVGCDVCKEIISKCLGIGWYQGYVVVESSFCRFFCEVFFDIAYFQRDLNLLVCFIDDFRVDLIYGFQIFILCSFWIVQFFKGFVFLGLVEMIGIQWMFSKCGFNQYLEGLGL